jgi:predicted ATPase
VKVLATSRERLRVYGEREIAVSPLAVPDLAALPAWTALETYPAVQLFVERAQAVKPVFGITPENADAVARLCVGLDGLPLALEMAAARVKWETPQTLLPQLSRRLETLRGREREMDPRQRTLRGALDWSYDLLDDSERRVLEQVSVFRGGFTLEAAEAVCVEPVAEALETLIEKSLVKQERDAAANTRFVLLETVRDYAMEKLERGAQADAVRERHLRYFQSLTSALGYNMARVESVQVYGQLKREHENVRGALEWALASGRNRDALNFAAALVPFWYHSSAMMEALEWLEPVLAMPGSDEPQLLLARAQVRNVYADFLRINGDMRRARIVSEQAIEDWKQVGKGGESHLAFAYLALGRTALWQGDLDVAEHSARAALELYTVLEDVSGQANALRRLGEWAATMQEYEFAVECLDRAITLTRDLNAFSRAVALLERGDIARWQGNYGAARRFYEAADRINNTDPDSFLDLRLLQHFGILTAQEGDPAEGRRLLAEAARRAIRKNTRFNLVSVFKDLAYCAALLNEPQEAMRWTGVMEMLLDAYSAVLVNPSQAEHAITLELLATQAPSEQLDRWRREGAAMPLEQVLLELQTENLA